MNSASSSSAEIMDGTHMGPELEQSAFIEVSPEMTTLIGLASDFAPLPPSPVALCVTLAEVARLNVEHDAQAALARAEPGRLVFLVRREALERLGGGRLLESLGDFHLPANLRAIAVALLDPPCAEAARTTYQLAKSIEFVCEAIRQSQAGGLIPVCGDGNLSAADTRRIMAARGLIEERACEKLTLDRIARACGVNRSKLTRGFKELFDCTVAEAIAARRLDLAQGMLLTTDKPVASIGQEAGYLNNASFARAFGRRFGRTPSDYRQKGLAA